MEKLCKTGRIFYAVAIAAMGFQTIYFKDFHPYLLPPNHSWLHAVAVPACIFGALLILAGAGIAFEKKAGPISLLLGAVLLLIVCFYYIPYELLATPNYMHWGEWENAEKELALSCGAFIIAGCFSQKNKNAIFRVLGKLIPAGTILFSIIIACFGINHFLYTKEVADYTPAWVPDRMFWAYFAGTALIGSGIGIALNIRRRLMAILLGLMIFIWFVILHIPKAISAPPADRGDEVISAFLALAYSGTAFVIAGLSVKSKGFSR
jgi:uncharacterized membrane protein AbrB (regulator of aidB expression)